MDQDIAVLYKLLDGLIKKSKSEDEFKEFVCTLERKYENQNAFIHSLACNAHVGLKADKLGNALIPEDLPLQSAENVFKAVKTTGNGDCLYNAVSLTLVHAGDESYSRLLRLLVALELIRTQD